MGSFVLPHPHVDEGSGYHSIRTRSVPNGSGGAWSSASYTMHIISSTFALRSSRRRGLFELSPFLKVRGPHVRICTVREKRAATNL